MTVDLTPAEMKALIHALNMRVAVFNERLQEAGGKGTNIPSYWRLIRTYIHMDEMLRDKLRAALAAGE